MVELGRLKSWIFCSTRAERYLSPLGAEGRSPVHVAVPSSPKDVPMAFDWSVQLPRYLLCACVHACLPLHGCGCSSILRLLQAPEGQGHSSEEPRPMRIMLVCPVMHSVWGGGRDLGAVPSTMQGVQCDRGSGE